MKDDKKTLKPKGGFKGHKKHDRNIGSADLSKIPGTAQPAVPTKPVWTPHGGDR
jgi:hypothetical protein